MLRKQKSTEIMSIFGQCEAVAAEIMIKDGKLSRIEQADIPLSALRNKDGDLARFAVIVPAQYLHEFEELIKDIRA